MFPDLSPFVLSARFANFVRASRAGGGQQKSDEDYGLQSTVEHSTNLRAVVLVEN